MNSLQVRLEDNPIWDRVRHTFTTENTLETVLNNLIEIYNEITRDVDDPALEIERFSLFMIIRRYNSSEEVRRRLDAWYSSRIVNEDSQVVIEDPP